MRVTPRLWAPGSPKDNLRWVCVVQGKMPWPSSAHRAPWTSWRRRRCPGRVGGGGFPGDAGTSRPRRWVVTVPGARPAQAGAGVHEVDVLPTAQCPEGQGHSQGATGVSRCGWSWSLGRITVGDRDGGSAPPPAMVLCQSPVTSVSFLLRNAPISQMGSLRLRGASVVPQPGIGRA